MSKKRKPLLSEEEQRELDAALGYAYAKIHGCPLEGCGIPQEFKAIGYMLEAARAGPGFGVDVSLVCREMAREMPEPYTASASSPLGAPCGTVITNRGPFVAAALTIIEASKQR